MKVGIVAVAQSKFGEHPEWRSHELTYLVVEDILKKVGLPFRDGYDYIVTCSSDHWDGKTLSDIEHGEVAGAHLGPGEEKVAMDGANAVLRGTIKILSGHADVVLVTAACKERDVRDPSVIENFGFDVPFQQLIGLDFTQAAALQAVRFMHKYGLRREDFAEAAVQAKGNARFNPFSSDGGKVSLEEVLQAEMLAYPISSLERRPACDGACVLILAKEERARELTDKPVWIRGIGSCYDAHNLGDRDLAEPEALFRAARDAYRMSGIQDPRKGIDLFEISEHYSYQLLLWMEGLGLCGRGESAKFLRSGEISREGKLPVNPSGGLLGGVPRYVAGANRVIEAFLQLRGEITQRAGAKPSKVALAHGTYGPAGQHHCVIILERGF
jgi:acetyl-CoA C-acetyltransferase